MTFENRATVQHARAGYRFLMRCSLILALALLATARAAAAGPTTHILYHEPVLLQISSKQAAIADQPGPRSLVFDAFGRRFDLRVDDGGRLNARRRLGGYKLLRGTVYGAPGSWVRLTATGNTLDGMIWDGQETWVIQPRAAAKPFMLGDDNGDSENIIYRAVDTMITGGSLNCGMVSDNAALPDGSIDGQSAMNNLVAEMQNVRVFEAQGATGRLSVAAVADFEFLQDFLGSEAAAENAIMTRFNIVDGIYSEQLGVEIDLADVRIFTSPTEEEPPFSDTTDAKTLLDQVSDYRQANHSQFGATHMLTGRNLQGSTAGIAYQGLQINGVLIFGVCDLETAASLSQGSFSTMTSALIIAHEFGHNFGAPHDGMPDPDPGETNPCESVPQTFLMAPDINGNDQFSQCSLDQIEPVLNAARSQCIEEFPVEGVSVFGPSSVSEEPDTPFTLAYTVSNTGTQPATNVDAQLIVAGSLELVDLNVDGGTCDTATASCTLGTLDTGINRTLIADVQGDTEGTFPFTVQVSADVDDDTSDNSRTTQVSISSEPVTNPSGGGSGGGGGSASLPAVIALFCLALLRRRCDIRK